ncbi:MAG TPA: PAS domain-containing sensor histidine kinase [Planktothrix sp.]
MLRLRLGSDEIADLDHFFHQMAITLDEATKKERSAVENAVDVICSLDSEGRIAAINPACEKNWGYAASDLTGMRLVQIVQDADTSRCHSMIEQAVTSKNTTTFENQVKRKDATLADTQWSMNWSQEEQSLFCIASDISERKRLDAERKQFVALVRDGLKTPLVSIHECLRRLSDSSKLSEAGQRGLIMAEENSARLIDLVNDLLDIERMESGKLQLTIAPCTVLRLLERSIHAVGGLAQVRRVKVETAEIGEITIDADEDRLVQVLVNLLSNAIKFSDKYSSVTISARDDGDWLEISVKDLGRGVPPEMREAIFERFKQVEAADERVKGGRGLGLAICKTIIEEHGGSIGMCDNQPCGSDFWIRLNKTT